MHNINDSENESFDSSQNQNMSLLTGALSGTVGNVNDSEVTSYDESDPVAKKRIII